MAQSSNQDVIPPTASGSQLDKLDLILKEIRDLRAAIEAQIGTLTTSFTLLKADHAKLADKVKNHKTILDDLVPQQTATTSQVEQLQRQLKGI